MGSDGNLTMANDVRMKGFSNRVPVEKALQWVDQNKKKLPTEEVKLNHSAGRVLTSGIASLVNVPGFRRSMMDGFAIRAEEVLGASNYKPIRMSVIGESLPGNRCGISLKTGQTVRVMTGAEVPENANAVVPVEFVEIKSDAHCEWIDVLTSIPEQKNISRIGEDIAVDEKVFDSGRKLRPQDVGVLASIGIQNVPVIRQPVVRIIVTGNELLPAGSIPNGVQIVDSNSPMLKALIERDGGTVVHPGIIPDDEEQIAEALMDDCDVILVAGGSSTGKEDFAPQLVAKLGELSIHGIAMRPSSPAGMGKIGNKTVFLLPGNPVSCLCAYDFFAGRFIRQMGGLDKSWPYVKRSLPLSQKIVSTIGRTDYARVNISVDGVVPIAISGASILSSTSKADGFCVIPQDSEGLAEATDIDVFLYD